MCYFYSRFLGFMVLFSLYSTVLANDWNRWTLHRKQELGDTSFIRVTADGLRAQCHAVSGKAEFRDLSATKPLFLESGRKYILDAVITAERAGEVAFVYKQHDPYKSLGLSVVKKLVPGKNRFVLKFTAKEHPEGKTPLITIGCGRIGGGITVSDFSIIPDEDKKLSFAVLSDDWCAEYQGRKKNVKAVNGVIDFRRLFGKQPQRSEAVLTKTFFSNCYGTMRVGVSADWWMEIIANGKRVFSTLARGQRGPLSPKTSFVDIPVLRGENEIRIRVLSGSDGWSFIYGEPASTIIPEKTEKWWKTSVPLENGVVEGSALDLSSIVPGGKKDIKIVYSPAIGSYAYENDLETPIRLFVTESIPWEVILSRSMFRSEMKARKELDCWAQSLRRRGYGAVRMHILDGRLCYLSDQDMKMDPKALDRVMYAFHRLKQEGMRLQLTILAYYLYSSRQNATTVFSNRVYHKIGFMFLNDFECERFRYGAEVLLNTVNPYTKKRLADDPLLMSVELYNEMEVGADLVSNFYYWNNGMFTSLKEKIGKEWESFLKRRGLTLRPLPRITASGKNDSPDTALFFEFHAEQLDRSFHWGEKVLRDLGWQGVIVQNSQSKRVGYGVSRWRCAHAVEAHGYFAHPSAMMSSGSQTYQRSSIEGLAEQFRSINSVRLYGRAFHVGEYNHVFWNRYIHEGGVVFPALAAFQGYQAITHYSDPYTIRKSGVSCFCIAENPVMAANGFLAAVLFGRGDVRPTSRLVRLNIPDRYLKQGANMYFPINSEQSKIALMTGFCTAFPDQPPVKGVSFSRKPDFELEPANHGDVNRLEWTSNIRDINDGSFDLAGFSAMLKKQGILPSGNLSDPAKGLFQTDTGEITINGPEKWMSVVTDRTEAVSWNGKSEKRLKCLTVFSSTGHATVAVSAVDGKSLQKSARIVLIYNTEAINSGMELAEDWKTLYLPGRLPVLLRTGTLRAEIVVPSGNWRLYALGLDGSRREELPIENRDGRLNILLDTAVLKKGVTPFFELCRM